MSTYSYKALNCEGGVVEGAMEALKEGIVVRKLQDKGYIPIRIISAEGAEEPTSKWSFSPSFKGIKRQARLAFTQELATLLKAGLPIDRSLRILINTSGGDRNTGVFPALLKDVVEGVSFADALARHPRVFPPLYISLVRSGESSGALDVVLDRLAVFLRRSEEMRSHIISSMIYPVLLLAASGCSILILLIFVIPKFTAVFSGAGVPLPLSTEILLTVSRMITDYWLVALALGFMGGFAGRTILRTRKGRILWDGFKLRVPILGDLIQQIEMSRFTRTLGTVVKGGVPILQSLHIAQAVLKNRIMRNSIREITHRVKEGERIGASLGGEAFIPPLVTEMITVGEETGRLEHILLDLAEALDKEIKERIKRLLALIEPGLILVMGVIVGAIVISMLMAIFTINEIPF